MRSLKRCSRCYWSAVDCDGRATCSWSRLTALLLERLLGVLVLHWGSLDGPAVQWSLMKPNNELIRQVPTTVFADLLLSLVTVRLTERATRTALLEMYLLTGSRHLVDCHVLCVCFSVLCCPEEKSGTCFSADCQEDTCFGRSFTTVSWRYRGYVSLLR
jgi:hypothetical protein